MCGGYPLASEATTRYEVSDSAGTAARLIGQCLQVWREEAMTWANDGVDGTAPNFRLLDLQ